MTQPPSGTITFLFSDIEGSSDLWERFPESMKTALADHDRLMAEIVDRHDGYLVKTTGDGILAVFERAPDAAVAGVAIQQTLQEHDWGELGELRVRIGLHTGTAQFREDDYYGPAVNRAARLMSIGHGGQILVSVSTRDLLVDEMPEDVSLQDLGHHQLKDLARPEHVYQVNHPDLDDDFPPLTSLDHLPHNLPRQLTSFIGREGELHSVIKLIREAPLVTLTGIGGTGKTRLALQVGAELVEEFPDGVWWADLAPLFEPELVPSTVAEILGVKEQSGKLLLDTIAAQLERKELLLILDNCEHLVEACVELADRLLHECPKLRILATSREGLGIAGEHTWQVASLSAPQVDAADNGNVDRLLSYDAVQLFVERARAVQSRFELTPDNAEAVVQICRRLDGIPLALELAAARVTVLPPTMLAERLDDRFRYLTGGSRTALPRQQTLKATLDWSYDLLDEAEKTLLRRLSVFQSGWDLEAAEAVCAGDPVEETDVFDRLTRLVEKSLVVANEHEGEARYRLLETFRQYARERLLESGEADEYR